VEDQKVKNDGVQGVILRCGHMGTSKRLSIDALFEEHYKGFTKVGLPIGVYWFSRAVTLEEAYNEADYTLRLIQGKNIQLPVYWDTEDNIYQVKTTKSQLTKVALAYLNKIKDNGYMAGVYASVSWLNNRLDMKQLDQFEVWVAQYNKVCTYKGHYEMWQYSSSGKVNGIYGNVDMNHCYKNYIDVKPTKKYIYLSRFVPSWRVYPMNKPCRVGNEVGKLAPLRFGGLKYEILETLPNSVYVIETATYGKVKLWAGKGTLHTIKEE